MGSSTPAPKPVAGLCTPARQADDVVRAASVIASTDDAYQRIVDYSLTLHSRDEYCALARALEESPFRDDPIFADFARRMRDIGTRHTH